MGYNNYVSHSDAQGGVPEGDHRIIPRRFTVTVLSTLQNSHPSAKSFQGDADVQSLKEV